MTDLSASYLLRTEEPPFTPETNAREKASFIGCFPQEYPTAGLGDYRETALAVRTETGYRGCELHYEKHEIFHGKKSLAGLPATFGSEEECETLELTLKDELLDLEAVLCFSVFEFFGGTLYGIF